MRQKAASPLRKPGVMSRPQIIHSGHFMVSEPHADPEPEAGLSPGSRAASGREPEPCAGRGGDSFRGAAGDEDGAQVPGAPYDFDTVNEGTCQTYRYGPRSSGALSIDASLTKLFECMTLAYSGKIVSPKWKTFKGLKLLQRDKIRLNNAIWRAWYLQYVEKRQNPVCNFVTPLECSDSDEHRKPEAVIMEGKYWKRQIGVVIREYHKWRAYFHIQGMADALPGVGLSNETEGGCPMELDPLHDLDALISELADTIFSSRNHYGGPNPRGLAHQGNADMIQPTLTQLHPNFGEEFMDTLDPIHDFFNACRAQPTTQAPILLPDAAALSPCDPAVSPSTTSSKELPLSGDSLAPMSFPLELEPSITSNGHFLPLFPTSPLRVSPPPGPPTLQPHPALVFSVITHTGTEKPPLPCTSTPGGTFAVPASGPPTKSRRHRQLQRIAPAPPFTHAPTPPSAFLTRLLITGPAPQPLASARSSPQVCGPSELPPSVLLRPTLGAEKRSVPGSARSRTVLAGVKAEIRDEHRTLRTSHETYGLHKDSRRLSAASDHTRRMNISSGFNTLASLVLPRPDQANLKLSKAVLLQRSVAYVGRLQQERRQVQEAAQQLRGEIEELSAAIGEFQRQLPPSGVPVAPPRSDQASRLYDEYVRQRTLQDWRFWLFSMVIKPLFDSYSRMVSTGSAEEFCQSVLSWLERHCTLPVLRPAISSSLLQLSKLTSILTQPARLPEQALQAVSRPAHSKGHS
uniref:BHLH domain-containing protein n=1 Tax=Sphenodon punctatus TaxID=8508 RepID=A0A8D0GWQ7_SPHPU